MQHKFFAGVFILMMMLAFSSCGKYITETGKASYYGDEFVHQSNGKWKKIQSA